MTTGDVGLEHGLESVEHLAAELGELRAAVIDRRRGHRAQHAIGRVGRAGNLQEVASAANHRPDPTANCPLYNPATA